MESAEGDRFVRRRAAHDRFQVWGEAGDFLRLWQVGVEQFDELHGIDWEWLSLDGAMTKRRWAEKTGANPTDCGQGGVMRSLLTEGRGVPIRMVVEGANRHDMKLVRATCEQIVVERPQPSVEQPHGMCLDKGYDCAEVRAILAEFGITAHIQLTWGRGSSPQRRSGLQSATLGGGAHLCVVGPVSAAESRL